MGIKKKWNEFCSNHEEWISSFGSNFVATVLGIVLTFGVSEWLERREDQASAEALVERSLKNLEQRLNELKMVEETLLQQDSLLSICTNALPDSLNSISDDVFVGLISGMNMRWSLFTSKSVEIGFKQDIHSQKILGVFADALGEAFESMNYAENVNIQVNEYKTQFQRMTSKYWTLKGYSLTHEKCIEMLSSPESIFYLSQVSVLTHSIQRVNKHLENFLIQIRRLWNKEISYEEFVELADPNGTLI